jgi:DNA-binding transcriptional LysR family regulator
MVWSGNPLVGESISFDDYMNLGHVAVHFGDERAIAFEEWFLPRYGRQRQVEMSVDNFSILPLMVMGTHRIATLHRRQAEYFSRHFPVRLVATPFEMPPVVEMMSWPSHLDSDPAHAWLRQLLIACASAPDEPGEPAQAPGMLVSGVRDEA